MTTEEFRQALSDLTDQQFAAFRESWGGTADTVEGCAQKFAYAPDPVQWERIAIFRLRQLGVTGLLTEDEKALMVAADSAAAAKASAQAAKGSAVIAFVSLLLAIAAAAGAWWPKG